MDFQQMRIPPVSSVAKLEVVKQLFGHSPRTFHQHTVSNQKLALIGYTLHVAGVGGTVKDCVLAKHDLLCDRSATFDSNGRDRWIVLCDLDLVGQVGASYRYCLSSSNWWKITCR